jgi:hypothetical protein
LGSLACRHVPESGKSQASLPRHDERWIAERLASEGHNVTHIPPKKSGDTTPDMAVDAKFVEIKTSTGRSVRWLRKRLIDGRSDW